MRSVAFLTAVAVLVIAPLGSAQINLGAGGWDGVMLDAVPPGTPAAQAGLQTGDIVLEVNGRSVDRSEDLVAAVQAAKPGSPLAFKISRAGRAVSLNGVAQSAPAQQGARSGRFTLKGWQAYNFDRNTYEESSGNCDFCLTAQLRVGMVCFFAAPKIKFFETRPDVSKITRSEIETWKDNVYGPQTGFFVVRTPSNRYFLLHMSSFENYLAAPVDWKASFTFEEIRPQ